MAIIPDPAGLKRQSINPNKSVVSLENSGAEGLATAKLSVAAGNSASRVARMALYHAEQQDVQQAKDAELQLRAGVLELSKEALAVKGKDAYTQGPNGYNTRWDARYQELQERVGASNNLSENGMMKYNSAAKLGGVNFRAKRYQHSMTQEDAHKSTLFTKGLEVTLNEAVTADNANITAGKIKQGGLEIISEFQRQGVTDQKIIDHALVSFSGKVHAGIVDRLLANGDSGGAVAYIQEKQTAGELTSEQGVAMMKVVKPEVDYHKGLGIAGHAKDMIEGGSTEEEVNDYVSETAKNKAQSAGAHTEITKIRTAIEDRQTKLVGTIIGGALDGTGRGKLSPELEQLREENIVKYAETFASLNAIEKGKQGLLAPDPTREQEYIYFNARTSEEPLTLEWLNNNFSRIGRKQYQEGRKLLIAGRDKAKETQVTSLKTMKLNPQWKKIAYPHDSDEKDRRIIDGYIENKLQVFMKYAKRIPNHDEEVRIMRSALKEFSYDDKGEYLFGTKKEFAYLYDEKTKGDNPDYKWPTALEDYYPPGTTDAEKSHMWKWIEETRKIKAYAGITDVYGMTLYYYQKEKDEEKLLKNTKGQ